MVNELVACSSKIIALIALVAYSERTDCYNLFVAALKNTVSGFERVVFCTVLESHGNNDVYLHFDIYVVLLSLF